MTKAHGGDIYTATSFLHSQELLDFSANLNPFGAPESMRKAIADAAAQIIHYPDPDCRELRQALAEYHRISPERVVCGNGGADIIYRTARALHAKDVLIPVPTFSEYADAFREAGSAVTFWDMPPSLQVTDELLSVLQRKKFDCLVLCNPNNPTGSVLAPELRSALLRFAAKEHICVLLDECFWEMTAPDAENYSVLKELAQYPNVIVVRSLTKLYAIPGLRIGYGICADTAKITQIQHTGQPWPVNVLASAAGCALLRESNYRETFLAFLMQERRFLYDALQEFGFSVWEPHANYVFFRAAGIPDLDERLLAKHILIRHCDNYEGLTAEHYRVAVRTHAENQKLLDAIAACVRGGTA